MTLQVRDSRVVLTGAFKRTKREMLRMVLRAGGRVDSSVTGRGKNRTDVVVVGEVLSSDRIFGAQSVASPDLIAKAERFGIPVVSEDELLLALSSEESTR